MTPPAPSLDDVRAYERLSWVASESIDLPTHGRQRPTRRLSASVKVTRFKVVLNHYSPTGVRRPSRGRLRRPRRLRVDSVRRCRVTGRPARTLPPGNTRPSSAHPSRPAKPVTWANTVQLVYLVPPPPAPPSASAYIPHTYRREPRLVHTSAGSTGSHRFDPTTPVRPESLVVRRVRATGGDRSRLCRTDRRSLAGTTGRQNHLGM